METTLTMAGLLADAGAARLRAGAALVPSSAATGAGAYRTSVQHHTSGGHQVTTWISGALAKPATVMVFDRKNRPTRPLSELSP